jgi:hypothetical protein
MMMKTARQEKKKEKKKKSSGSERSRGSSLPSLEVEKKKSFSSLLSLSSHRLLFHPASSSSLSPGESLVFAASFAVLLDIIALASEGPPLEGKSPPLGK